MDTFGSAGEHFVPYYNLLLDPYLEIFHADSSGNAEGKPVYTTEVIKNNLNPVWKSFNLKVGQLVPHVEGSISYYPLNFR
jgi:hypothetical protein